MTTQIYVNYEEYEDFEEEYEEAPRFQKIKSKTHKEGKNIRYVPDDHKQK